MIGPFPESTPSGIGAVGLHGVAQGLERLTETFTVQHLDGVVREYDASGKPRQGREHQGRDADVVILPELPMVEHYRK